MAKHGSKNANKAKNVLQDWRTYVDAINPSYLGGSFSAKDWLPIHGDGKSSADGQFSGQTRKSTDGKFLVQIVQKGGTVLRQLEYSEEPTLAQVGRDVKAGKNGKQY